MLGNKKNNQLALEEVEVLNVIADGASEIKYISTSCEGIKRSKACRAILNLCKDEYAESVFVRYPDSKSEMLIKLTQKGKDLYKELTGKTAKPPEMDILKDVYGSYEIGYGVKSCFELLKRSGTYDSVDMFPGLIEVPQTKEAFKPDIVCVKSNGNNSSETVYYMYFNGKLSNDEYFKLMDSLTMITNEVNVIAPLKKFNTVQAMMVEYSHRNNNMNKKYRLTSYSLLDKAISSRKPVEEWWATEWKELYNTESTED